MAAFTAKDVMTLREQTGAGMMDCKRALVDADGDMNKAVELLRERGIAKAAKKATRIAAEGIVTSYIEGNTGVLLEVNCESDFVAKGDKFHELAKQIAKQIAATKPATVEELLAQNLVGEDKTVELFIKEQIAVIGEKISVRRFTVYTSEGLLESYIHMGGTLGVMLDFDAPVNDDTKALAHDVALHVAFANRIVGFAAKTNASRAFEGDFDEFRTKERHRDDGDFAVHLRRSEAAKARHRKLREIADFVGRHGIEASDGIAEGDAYGSERCESKTSDPHGSNRRLCVLRLFLELWSNAKGDIDDVYTRLLSVIDINYLFHRQNCIVCVSLFCEAPDDSFDSISM